MPSSILSSDLLEACHRKLVQFTESVQQTPPGTSCVCMPSYDILPGLQVCTDKLADSR